MVKYAFSGIEQVIYNHVTAAKHEILVAVYLFTNKRLFRALCEQAKNGRKVLVVIHNDPINFAEYGLPFEQLIEWGGALYVSPDPNLMHNKFCVIDNAVLINGSYNWTFSAENLNLENVLVVQDSITVPAFRNQFFTIIKPLGNPVRKEHLFRIPITELQLRSQKLLEDMISTELDFLEVQQEDIPPVVADDTDKEYVAGPATKNVRRLQYSLGIGVKDNGYLKIIERGEEIPVRNNRKEIVTADDNQKEVEAVIYYGDKEECTLNYPVHTLFISNLPPMPSGRLRFNMNMRISEDGKLDAWLVQANYGRAIDRIDNIDIRALLSHPVSPQSY